MLLLLFNNSVWEAEALGQKLVYGLQDQVWRIGTENSNFIENTVSMRTVKMLRGDQFSPFFWCHMYSVMIACVIVCFGGEHHG